MQRPSTTHNARRTALGGFTLIEAVLIMTIIASSFLGFGYLFGNVDQEALKADLTILATKLAKERMEELIQTKADSGYAAISVGTTSTPVTSGTWNFTRVVTVSYVNPADFSSSASDTGYKKVLITVSWGAGTGASVALTTLMTNMVPSAVVGPGYPACP